MTRQPLIKIVPVRMDTPTGQWRGRCGELLDDGTPCLYQTSVLYPGEAARIVSSHWLARHGPKQSSGQ